MLRNGGFATLAYLYQQVDTSAWKTKTPHASIRRIVQDERFFFKIRPGLWALNEKRHEVSKLFRLNDPPKQRLLSEHYYYQGLAVEIGNLKGFTTYIPAQDKNKKFLTTTLHSIAKTSEIPSFTYPRILRKIKSVDVIWFNTRMMPDALFEIEITTDFNNSLIKFSELQDFRCRFFIVSASERREEFEGKLSAPVFFSIKNYVKFLDFNALVDYYTKISALHQLAFL